MNDRAQIGFLTLFAIMMAIMVAGTLLVFGVEITGAIFDSYTVGGAFTAEAAAHEDATGDRIVMGAMGLVLTGLLAAAMFLYSGGGRSRTRQVRRRF